VLYFAGSGVEPASPVVDNHVVYIVRGDRLRIRSGVIRSAAGVAGGVVRARNRRERAPDFRQSS